MTTVLYLDVDGVLCPVVPPDESIDEFADWQLVPPPGRVPWSPTLIGALSALPIERRWLTSWQHEANERLAPLFGWSTMPVLEYRPGSLWWKFDALMQHHERGVPFVWIDDELDERRRDLTPMFDAGLASLDAPYLCLSPWTYRGITREDIARIAAFCADPYAESTQG